MKAKHSIEFPCGYKYSASMSMWSAIAWGESTLKNLPICPIHGKQCFRQEITQKRLIVDNKGKEYEQEKFKTFINSLYGKHASDLKRK